MVCDYYFVIITLSIVLVDCVVNDKEVNYYVNLITSELRRANSYYLANDSKTYRPLFEEYLEFGIYDHIVIGAGAAGAIVATRLSEDSKKSVLLVEAGGFESNFTDIPRLYEDYTKLEYNWNYATIPQENACLGLANRKCAYPRGKGIGGSTIINGLFYARGTANDYDNWRDRGNLEWGFGDVLPFFKKLENYKIDADDGYHGHEGYVNVEYSHYINDKTRAFLKANEELGATVCDYNGRGTLCTGRVQVNNIRGRRGSTGRAYIRRVLEKRPNLYVSTNSYTTKILISSAQKKAYGIVFAKNNKYYVAFSNREIVISAGVFGSPQLLMLSGIGPSNHLSSLGIPLVQDLPVGNLFEDHMAYIGLFFSSNYSEITQSLEEKVREYLNGKGVLTDVKSGGVAFIETPSFTTPNQPNIELAFYETPFRYLVPVDNPQGAFQIYTILLHPKSRGSFRLKSSDPFEYPLIDPNLLSDADNEDIKVTYEGIQYALRLLETDAFKKLNIRLLLQPISECDVHEYLSRNYWYCHIRHLSRTFGHGIGTCKMGASPAEGAVVDSKLRVFGIRNLMVADSSVMPTSTSGHTSAPSMMIGEKAAHMIRSGQTKL